MTTEELPADVPHEPVVAPKPIDESSPASLILPPQPDVSSPASPFTVIPHEDAPNNAVSVPSPPTKTEEGNADTLKPQMDEESISTSTTVMLASGGGGFKNRDEALAKVNQDKTYSHIRAWEENEKAKSINKFQKIMSKIDAWENTKKATAEAKLRRAEEKLEKKRAAYVERMKNEIAEYHRQTEERRAIAEAKRGQEILQIEEMAAKYKVAGQIPRRYLCWGG